MHKLLLASALAGIFSASAANADNVNLDFNGATSFSSVAAYYNGGTDGAGASGINYGVGFSGSVLALTNDGTGSGSAGQFFTNAPTGTVIFANKNDVASIMDVTGPANGFSNSLTLTYSSTSAPTIVNIWSGLDDTGTLLGSFSLAANSDACGAANPACNWTTTSLSFIGNAQSVDFSSNAGNALFTNISYAVPLPASGLLMSFGLAGLAMFGVRRRAA